MKSAYFEAARATAGDEFAATVAEDIVAVERVLCDRLGSNVETVSAIGDHVLSAGGKRLRPLFAALWGRAVFTDVDAQRLRNLGAALEMIHMATLIHDDVVDMAETRRGRPTVSTVYGNNAAILSGDVLLAKAMELLAEDGDLTIIRMVSRMVVEMAEGEVKEVEARGEFELNRETHYDILNRKTAAFISCCCKLGVLVAGKDDLCNAAEQYGREVGLAFQIADDLLDYRATPETSGKPRATDFRDGQSTLPLILLREQLTAEEAEFTKSKFGNGVTETDLDQITEWMSERDCFSTAEQTAHTHAEAAVNALGSLKDSPAKALLNQIATMVVSRNS